ncbi:hypothetical protein COX69_03170 [Candidatus Falkowbacteria bacterium CG_4_10_14_0_2_um_filter_48_10]|uniref:Uncharacterized protein n=1 Tax=Candidatus Falkowbacteria bacterium CG23_combo_of_CG06-09_8_20_14_all_49_15 TaxID=1974572 RepID=A0A2G9ZLX9_9BACT|nr:MAG: hypothetical protein COX22_00475 [Candidatus Falkowbacteria bacterium CG23_combo_of_CG06-09_8_20_14_all_49_15]PJA08104.1 MAG: hypothetical protein COX69_03170 [Candidatus Falkowbacteria bacterium CG_4_10_14_0_2_um_filter_48_10]
MKEGAMKKFFLFLIVAFLAISFSQKASAADTNSNSALIQQFSDNHGNYTYGDLLNSTKQDPTVVNGLQPFPAEKTNDTRLPVLLGRYGFVLLDDFDEVYQGIRVENLLAGKSNWWDSSENFYPLEAEDTTAAENDRVSLLPYYPWGVEKVGEAFIAVPKDHEIITPYLYEAIRKVWSKTGCRYYTVLTNMRQITANMGWGAGISFVGSVLPAPDSHGSRTGMVSGTGVGAGKFESFVWQKPGFYVIGWQHYLSENEAKTNLARFKSRAAVKAAETVKKEETVTKKVVSVSEPSNEPPKTETKILPTAPILFAYDSDVVAHAEEEKIRKWANDIARIVDKIQPNQKIVLIGGASIEGTDRHNWDLAGRRAENAALKMAEMLINLGVSKEWINEHLQFQSVGENFIQIKEDGQHPKNRCVYIAVQNRLT